MPYKTGVWGIQEKQRNHKRFSKSVGKKAELEALELLGVNEKLRKGKVADIKWLDKLIDVKTSIFNTKTKRWKFLLYQQKGKIDFFLVICKDNEAKTKYIFLIPDKDLKFNNLTISLRNIDYYKKYLFRS